MILDQTFQQQNPVNKGGSMRRLSQFVMATAAADCRSRLLAEGCDLATYPLNITGYDFAFGVFDALYNPGTIRYLPFLIRLASGAQLAAGLGHRPAKQPLQPMIPRMFCPATISSKPSTLRKSSSILIADIILFASAVRLVSISFLITTQTSYHFSLLRGSKYPPGPNHL